MKEGSDLAQLAPTVSVIVPLHRDGPVFRDCLAHLLAMEYPSYTVIIVTDDIPIELPSGVGHLSTGSTSSTPPGVKRDTASFSTNSKYLAFIDDDAFGRTDWLTQAVRLLEADNTIAAVGGPGLTPSGSSFRQRLSGAIYQSLFGSGPLRFRFLPGKQRVVDDLPAYNFVVRASALRSVGGWASTFYGGEDTKLCLELVRKGHILIYSPEVVVYHHRRAVLLPHMRQVSNVGMHRGFFIKEFPETSRRFIYLLPALGVFCLVALFVVAVWYGRGLPIFAAALLLGYLLVAAESFRREGPLVSAILPLLLFCHHVAYAFGFLRGLLRQELQR